ncbi:MAG: pyridoxamine 5'-phosphate oxidase family protein [Cypionkella sp.]
MSILQDVSIDPRGAVFDVLDEVRAGMLGLTGGGDGFQPMTHFLDGSAGVIWFISSTQTDLVQSLGHGEDADYVVISQDHDVHVSLRGKLQHLHDAAKLDELWSPMFSAWFDGGKDDPRVALLRFDAEAANVWASTSSSLKFGFEMLRANLDPEHRPAVGVKVNVTFPTAV